MLLQRNNGEYVYMVRFPLIRRMAAIAIEVCVFLVIRFIRLFPHQTSRKSLFDGKKVLIIEPFGMGDVVCIASAVKRIESNIDYRFDLCCNERWVNLAKRYNVFESVIPINAPWAHKTGKYSLLRWNWAEIKMLVCKLESENYDYGIDVRGDFRSVAILYLSNCQRRIGYKQYSASDIRTLGLFLTDSERVSPIVYRTERNLHLITRYLPRSFVKHSKVEKNGTLPQLQNVGAFVCSEWKYRNWKAESWAVLFEKMFRHYKCDISILGAWFHSGYLNMIKEKSTVPVEVVLFENPESICDELKSKKFDMIISLDTGPFHIAVDLGIATVSLFGPGSVGLWHPNTRNHIRVDKQHLFECSPCRQDICVHRNANCMDAITVDDVFAAVNNCLYR